MKPAPFDYHAPTDLDEVIELLGTFGDGAKVLAGGQSLVPLLALRLAAFEHLVDIGRLAELQGIRQKDDETLEIPAMTTQAELVRTPIVDRLPLVSRAASLIGHFQIRNRGTFGGSLAHADAASELPAVALALDAELAAAGPRGTRIISAADFFLGTWTTALEVDEVLTGATFRLPRGRQGSAVKELARRQGDFAVAGVACAVEVGLGGSLDHVSIAFFGMDERPCRFPDVERQLAGSHVIPADLSDFAHDLVSHATPRSDVHATSEYRKQVGAVLVEKALAESLGEAGYGKEIGLS